MNNEYLRVFKAFSDPKRVRILELLCENEECACVLLDDLQISQPTLSHHMRILCDSGIVTGRKVGKWTYYRINEEGREYAGKLITNLKEHKLGTAVKAMTRFFGMWKRIKSPFKKRRGYGQNLGLIMQQNQDVVYTQSDSVRSEIV